MNRRKMRIEMRRVPTDLDLWRYIIHSAHVWIHTGSDCLLFEWQASGKGSSNPTM
jgi:hypothetical protein